MGLSWLMLVVDVAFVGVCKKNVSLKCQEFLVFFLGEVSGDVIPKEYHLLVCRTHQGESHAEGD